MNSVKAEIVIVIRQASRNGLHSHLSQHSPTVSLIALIIQRYIEDSFFWILDYMLTLLSLILKDTVFLSLSLPLIGTIYVSACIRVIKI